MDVINHPFSRKNRALVKFLALALFTTISPAAWSSGFLFPQQNITNLGTARAGSASLAEDASTNFCNAAGLTRLCNPQVVLGATYVFPTSKLDVNSGTTTFGPGFPLTPGVARPKNQALIPLFHYAQPLDDCWSGGLSLVTTFGSKNSYDDQSAARYTATNAEMMLIDAAPSIGYRLTDHFSIGGGPDVIFTKIKLGVALGNGTSTTDGFHKDQIKGTGLGYHIAGLYEWDGCTRVGVNYRSQYTIRTKGDSFTQTAAGTPVTRQDVRVNVPFPNVATLSGYHALTDQFAVMGDLQWTRWDRLKQLILRFPDGTQSISNYNWKNTWLGAVGGIFQPNRDWQFKLGISYENTPTTDATRTISILDSDQAILGMGLKYQFSPCLAVDLGYTQVLFKKMSINQLPPTSIGGPQSAATLNGKVRHQIRALGLQFTWDLV